MMHSWQLVLYIDLKIQILVETDRLYCFLSAIFVFAFSLNGPMWLPADSSVICSEHFLEVKNAQDSSFIPGLFPARREADANAKLQKISDTDTSCDLSVFQAVVDKLTMADRDRVSGRMDTARLQEAFRELACHVCRVLVAHDSELLIEGTVGVTVDGGTRVMLLHFADQVRKNEASSAEETSHDQAPEHVPKDSVGDDLTANDRTVNDDLTANDRTVNEVPSHLSSLEDKTCAVGNADISVKLLPPIAISLPYSSGSSKILSELAQQATSTVQTGVEVENDEDGLPTHRSNPELTTSTVCHKPKQQTLLRELLCAPLPPKRPCRPVTTAAPANTTSVGSEVARPCRPSTTYTVLGGLLRTGNYQHRSTLFGSIYDRDPLTATRAGCGGHNPGINVPSSHFGGNAVRALQKLASEHAYSVGASKNRDSDVSGNKGIVTDGSAAEVSVDQRYSALYQSTALYSSDTQRTLPPEFAGTSQNSTRSNSSNTVCSTSEFLPLPMKQEAVDPGYE